MVRHVFLFDIDGTLVHAGGAGRLALTRALASEFGIAVPSIEIGFAGRTDRAIATEALVCHGLPSDDPQVARYLEAYLVHLPATLAERAGKVLPGVRELLAALSARRNVTLGLLTGNLERAAHLKLAHFALEGFFVGGGFGDHHRDRDDVARAAERALAEHLEGPASLWVVGDTPADVRCARAIGARAVAVSAGFATRDELRAAGPDVLLDDLSDTTRFLALLDDS